MNFRRTLGIFLMTLALLTTMPMDAHAYYKRKPNNGGPRTELPLNYHQEAMDATRELLKHETEALEEGRFDAETFNSILSEATACDKLTELSGSNVLYGTFLGSPSQTTFVSADGRHRYTFCLHSSFYLEITARSGKEIVFPDKNEGINRIMFEELRDSTAALLKGLPKRHQEDCWGAACLIEANLKMKPGITLESLLHAAGVECEEADRFLKDWRQGLKPTAKGDHSIFSFLLLWRECLACVLIESRPDLSLHHFAEAMREQASHADFPECLRFYVPQNDEAVEECLNPDLWDYFDITAEKKAPSGDAPQEKN